LIKETELMESDKSSDGYRHTAAGVIPQDWKVDPLRNLYPQIRNGFVGTATPFYVEKGVKYLQGKNIKKGRIIPDDLVYISEEFHNKQSKSRLRVNDIVMVQSGHVGECAVITPEYDNCNCHALIIMTPTNRVDSNYYSHFFNSNYGEKLIYKIRTGNTIEHILASDMKDLIVPVPSFREQQEISKIIASWDSAIALKEELLEEKKRQKTGLMQNLLTGKVRLPGFVDEWIDVKLGIILKERNEKGYVHLELLGITSQKGIVKRSEIDIKDNSNEDKSKYKRIAPLDIGYNTMRMWQGVSGVSKYEGLVSPAYTVLTPTNKVDSYFIGYLFKLPKVIDLFRRYSQGLVDDTLNLKYENLRHIQVKIPKDIKEQKGIAEVLSCCDRELDLLDQELEALKEQKRGLMQVLLTGKVRVQV